MRAKAFDKKSEFWLFIGIGLAFIFLNALALYFEFLWLGILPLIALVFLMGVFHIDWLLQLIVFLVPLSITVLDVIGGMGLTLPDEPFIIALFLLVIFKFIIDGKYDFRLFKHPISIAIFINTAWLFLATFTSQERIVSLKFMASRTWYIVVFYFLGAMLFRNFKNIPRYLWLYMIPLAFVIIVTLFKHSAESFSQKASFEIMQPFYEAHGVYSAAITFFIPILFIIAFFGYNMKVPVAVVAACFPLLLLFLIGDIFSFTRAAWMSIGAAAVFGALLIFRVRLNILLIALGFISFIVILNIDEIVFRLSQNKQNSAEGLENHFQSLSNINNDVSNLERVNRWVAAINMVKAKPITGFGPGAYSFTYAVYQDPDFETEITTQFGDQGHAHSEYLNPLSEAGWPGLISWLLVLYFVFHTAFKIIYHAKETHIRWYAAAIILALVTYLSHGFVNAYSEQDKIAVLLWGAFAMLAAMDQYHMVNADTEARQS